VNIRRDRQHPVAGMPCVAEHEDLPHEEHRAEQGLDFTAPETERVEIKASEDRRPHQHQGRADPDHSGRRAAHLQGHHHRNHDRIELREERRH
jgi:hypothetical protein